MLGVVQCAQEFLPLDSSQPFAPHIITEDNIIFYPLIASLFLFAILHVSGCNDFSCTLRSCIFQIPSVIITTAEDDTHMPLIAYS